MLDKELGRIRSENMNCNAYKLRLAATTFLLTMPAFAQSAPDTGQITGVVKDPSQAVVSGSQIVLTNQQTNVRLTATTDDQGVYGFSALQPGSYTVEVDVKGFRPTTSPELKVAAGQIGGLPTVLDQKELIAEILSL